MASFSMSPVVEFREIDLTTVVPAASTTVGAFVGNFQWGPVDQRMLVDSEINLVKRVGRPDSNTFVSFFTAANFLAYTNNLKLVRSVGPSAKNSTVDGTGVLIKNEFVWQNTYSSGQGTTGEWAGKYPGSLGNSLKVATCPSANAYQQNLTSAFSTTANATNGSSIVSFTSNVIANGVVQGDMLSIGGSDYTEILSLSANGLIAQVAATFSANAVANTVTKRWKYADYVDGPPGTSDFASSVGGSGDEIHVVVIDEDGQFSVQMGTSATVGGANTILEVFQFASKAFDARNVDGSVNYYRDVVSQKSQYVWWMDHRTAGTNWGSTAVGTTFTNVGTNSYQSLSGGITDAPNTGNLEAGYDLFSNSEEVDVSLILAGDANATLATYLIQSIAEIRRDAVVFVSPRMTDVVDQVGQEVDNITVFRNLLPSSSYAVMDDGWKYIFDKYNNVYRWVPLNGDIAGLCARTDVQRDAWWSPAGMIRGQIKNVVKLAWQPSKAARDDLYKIGVNSVVSFPAEGTVLWGDKTLLSRPSAFDRINVRRLFIGLLLPQQSTHYSNSTTNSQGHNSYP